VVEQHRAGAESRGVAKDPADIVVIGEPHEAEDGRLRPKSREELAGESGRLAPADREHAAVDREAHDRAHQSLRRHVDRHFRRHMPQ
jgi:hypothetical protein